LADGIDPAVAKREEKQEQADAAANTVEAVARIWLTKTDETHISRLSSVVAVPASAILEKTVHQLERSQPLNAGAGRTLRP
jgi:hypothetical protein